MTAIPVRESIASFQSCLSAASSGFSGSSIAVSRVRKPNETNRRKATFILATHRTAISLWVRLYCCSCLFLSTVCFAQATLHVPDDQPTIQAGINAAGNGDTVLVADGHYHEHINFNGKNITVTSVNGPAVTIIDGDIGTGPVVRFVSGEGRTAVIHGFTIEHGSFDSFSFAGSGIEVADAYPTISGNVVTQNSGPGEGGGIDVAFGGPIIDSNTISHNTVVFSGGTDGAGICVRGTPGPPLAQITNNLITGNFGTGFGGGIGLFAAGPVFVENNMITGNSAFIEGGGIDIVNNSGTIIVQNLITGNSAPSGSGIFASIIQLIGNTFANNGAATDGVVVVGTNADTRIENNIIVTTGTEKGLYCRSSVAPTAQSNDAFSFQGVATAYAGACTGLSGTNGNISADPKFVSSSNFHLLGNSPAIDAGDNSAPNLLATDLEGNPRIVDGSFTGTPTIDMGSYEFQSYTMSDAQPASVTVLHGDISPTIAFQLGITGKIPIAVTLACAAGLPANTTCNFSPSSSITLSTGAPVTVTLNIVTSPGTAPGTYSVTLSASAVGFVHSPTQTIGLTVEPVADLALSAVHRPNIAHAGGQVTFTFTVSNTGLDPTGVHLNITLTGQVLSVNATASQGSCTVTGPIHCSLGTITNGSNAKVTITAIPGSVLVRLITATGVVTSDITDINPANNTQSDTGQVRLRPFARN